MSCMVLRKNSDYLPMRRNLFAFITETGSNYCEVRAEPLSVIHVNQSGIGTVFLRILRFSSVSIIPPAIHISYPCTHCSYQDKWAERRNFPKSHVLSEIGEHGN